MAVNETLEILNLFPLNNISDEWSKGVWDSDFTEIDTIDDTIVEELNWSEIIPTLYKLGKVLDHWVKNESEEGLWTVLVENDISLKTFVAFLAYLIQTGNKRQSNLSQKEAAIAASGVYCKLVLVPGSAAFKVFHPELFEKSVDLLKLLIVIANEGASDGKSKKGKRSSSGSRASQGQKRGSKGKKRKKGPDPSFDEDSSLMDADNDDDGDAILSSQESGRLKGRLRNHLIEIISFLEAYSLRQTVSTAVHTVQVLSQLTRVDIDQFDGTFHERGSLLTQSIPALGYKGLQLLCSQQHGHVGSLMNATCKVLLPSLLMLVGDKSVENINKALLTCRDHAIAFICLLMKQCGDRGLVSIRTLLQHMCTKVTDRAEYRTKVAHAIISITKELPDENYSKMVQWFYSLSKHSQINYRGFAIEIVSALLATPERQASANISVELVPYITHKSLLGILLNRCSDRAPSIRARAITCFASCLTSRETGLAQTVRDVVTPMSVGGPPGGPRLIKTPGVHLQAQDTLGDGVTPAGQGSEVTIAQQTAEGSTIATEGQGHEKEGPSIMVRVELTPGFDGSLPDNEGVFSMLRRRCKDEKLNVRKAALQAMESAIRFEAPSYRKENLELLKDHCRDPGLSVRKQSLQSLSDLLMDMPKDKLLQQNWLLGVLPLVIDRETTLAEKCMDSLEEVILHNIVPFHRSTGECHRLAWDLLGIIARPHSVDQRRYLQKACFHWSRQGKIKPTLISNLETHIGKENNAAALMLLAEITPAAPKINHDFLLKYWENLKNEDCPSEIMERVLTIMKFVCKHIPTKNRETLIADLRTRLLKFDSPPELIAVSVSTLAKLCTVQSEATANRSIKQDWCNDLLLACDKYLSKVVLEEGTAHDEDLIVRHLFTLGEVVQLCPGKLPKRVFLLVQSMIATPCITSLPASQSRPESQQSDVGSHGSESQSGQASQGDNQSQPSTQPGAQQAGQSEPGTQDNQSQPASQKADQSNPSAQQEDQSSQHSSHHSSPNSSQDQSQRSTQTQSSQGFTQLTQFRGSRMSNRIRAFAFVTLGKLCLQHEDLAKKVVAALARELETSTDPAIRNNVVIVLCDLCVRYTTTANHYISNIASCIKDPSPLVRKQTLTLITRLLQEDFLKWKGAIFYRFVSGLLDECEEIRKFCEFCLVHMLIVRHQNMIFQHFMECIFHFNDYKDHAVYNKFAQSDKDRKLFSLEGDKQAKKRLQLYKFMLDHMTDDHKFQMQGKICQEILGAVVDGLMPLNQESSPVLKDALAILSSKEIKLSSLKARNTDEIPADQEEMAAVVVAAAKKTIITQVVKKNVIENIVPIVVALKNMLEKQRSPLLKELLMYLQELMKDYKNEVKEILSADRNLATEIEFDLRKFEEEQAEQARQRNAPPPSAQVTPQQGPHGSGRSPVPVPSAAGSPARTSPAVGRVGSPRLVGSPRPAGSPRPRTPARRVSVSTPGASKQMLPPVMRLAVQNKPIGTPAREAPLVNVAIMNAALRAGIHPEAPERGSMAPGEQNRTMSSDEDLSGGTPSTIPGGAPSTPQSAGCSGVPYRRTYRAISTPSAALSNITFQMDGNMTFIPPSPIAETENVQRLYDEVFSGERLQDHWSSGNTAGTPRTPRERREKVNQENEENQDQLILMKSPTAPQEKPRVWNVSSPAPIRSRKTIPEAKEEEDPLPLAENSQQAANQSASKGNQSVDNTSASNQSKSRSRPKAKPAKGGKRTKRTSKDET